MLPKHYLYPCILKALLPSEEGSSAMETTMEHIDRFVDAIRVNNKDTVRELQDMVDINKLDTLGHTGLMMAMYHNRLPLVTLLLQHPSIILSTRDRVNNTALHYACSENQVESVKLFLTHTQCTIDTVKMQGRHGNTAEIRAAQLGHHECAKIIQEFCNNHSSTIMPLSSSSSAIAIPSPCFTRPPSPPISPGRLTIAQLVQAIENVKIEENIFEENSNKEINSLQQMVKEALVKQASGRADIRRRVESLNAEIHQRTNTDHPVVESPVAAPAPSLVPQCPVCYEEMRPPRLIYNCMNGHLICSECQPSIRENRCINRCKSKYTGRATAMEQIVRQILGIM